MPSWPGTLPIALANQFGETDIDTNASDATDMGIVDVRATTTRVIRKFTIGIIITEAQRVILNTFHDITLKKVLPFDWTHPQDGQTYSVRFESRPAHTMISPGVYQSSFALIEV